MNNFLDENQKNHLLNPLVWRCTHRQTRGFLYMFCFLIPKIILKIPLKNFGLFTSTTFIRKPPISINYQQRQQEFRRAKATDKQTQSKGKPHSALIDVKAFSHFVPSLQYQYIEKTKKCYCYLRFGAFQGFKSFKSSNKAIYD